MFFPETVMIGDCTVNWRVPDVDVTEIVTMAYCVVCERFLRLTVHVCTPPEAMLTDDRAEAPWGVTKRALERTTTVTVVVWLTAPLVPLTVIWYVPVGVCPAIAAKVKVELAVGADAVIVTHVGLKDGLSRLAPVCVRQTEPAKPNWPVTVIVEVPLLPCM